jgi:hypothetical protein
MTAREHETQTAGAEPPVIDLAAEEVGGASDTATPEEPEAEAENPPSTPRRAFPTRTMTVTILTVVAIIAGALAYRSFGERLWPGERTTAMEQRLAALDASTHTLNQQLTVLGSAVDDLKAANSKLSERVDNALSAANSAAEQTKGLDERLSGDESALGDLQVRIEQVRNAPAGGSGNTTALAASLDALSKRVAALEEAVAALKSAPPPPTGGNPDTALLSQALADLKAKLASGAPYEAEAQTINRLVPGIAALDRLLPYAASGLPTATSLAGDIEALAATLPSVEPKVETADQGYWSGLTQFLGSIVTVRNIGETDWKAIGAKAAAEARAGDLAAANARLGEGGATLPPQLAQWRTKATARLGVDAAAEEVSQAVLRELSTSAGKS